jgi:hypothetical protein
VLQADDALLPSVRSGLEFAVLNLVAATRGVSLCSLLQGTSSSSSSSTSSSSTSSPTSTSTLTRVRVNGLLAHHASPEAVRFRDPVETPYRF